MTTVLLDALIVVCLLGPCVVCFLKGKPVFGVLGLFLVSPVAWVGAMLWAKPTSWWARRFYGPERLARAEEWFRPKSEFDAERLPENETQQLLEA